MNFLFPLLLAQFVYPYFIEPVRNGFPKLTIGSELVESSFDAAGRSSFKLVPVRQADSSKGGPHRNQAKKIFSGIRLLDLCYLTIEAFPTHNIIGCFCNET